MTGRAVFMNHQVLVCSSKEPKCLSVRQEHRNGDVLIVFMNGVVQITESLCSGIPRQRPLQQRWLSTIPSSLWYRPKCHLSSSQRAYPSQCCEHHPHPSRSRHHLESSRPTRAPELSNGLNRADTSRTAACPLQFHLWVPLHKPLTTVTSHFSTLCLKVVYKKTSITHTTQ